MGAVRSRNERR
jgi:Bacterial RNA polymerase, alpha chain C terminal domain